MIRWMMGLVLVMLMWAGTSEAMDGQEVYRRMKERDGGESMHAIMKMTLVDASGESKERVMETWSMRYDKEKNLRQSVMEFKSPATVKGTRFLQIEQEGRDDDQWIYLPAMGRVRRIAATEGEGSFMGSDFTYDDMRLQSGNDEADHVLLREEKFGGYECYVLESRSLDKDASYSRLVSWISKEHFLPLKVEFYDRKSGELKKEMTAEGGIVTIGGVDSFLTTRMKTLKDGHQTVLETMSGKNGTPYLEYNVTMNPARFTQDFLMSGK